jgi:ADP-ribose pyrophosphatase YjhB (NUDIX family)
MGIELVGKEGFALTTDMLIFSISIGDNSDCRKLSEKHFSILLVKRDKEPFAGKWCLPGGFVGINETMDDASDRVLLKETNLHGIYKEQLYTFDDINRDPRKRILSTAYMALIDKNKIKDELSKESAWFNIKINDKEKQVDVTLSNEVEKIKFSIKKSLKDKTTNKYQYTVLENDKLAFDHPLIILTGILRLKHKAEDTDIIFNMLPKYFTLGELQQIYEIILGRKLLDPAFRRIISTKVERTNEFVKTGGHRPSVLYKYKY